MIILINLTCFDGLHLVFGDCVCIELSLDASTYVRHVQDEPVPWGGNQKLESFLGIMEFQPNGLFK